MYILLAKYMISYIVPDRVAKCVLSGDPLCAAGEYSDDNWTKAVPWGLASDSLARQDLLNAL